MGKDRGDHLGVVGPQVHAPRDDSTAVGFHGREPGRLLRLLGFAGEDLAGGVKVDFAGRIPRSLDGRAGPTFRLGRADSLGSLPGRLRQTGITMIDPEIDRLVNLPFRAGCIFAGRGRQRPPARLETGRCDRCRRGRDRWPGPAQAAMAPAAATTRRARPGEPRAGGWRRCRGRGIRLGVCGGPSSVSKQTRKTARGWLGRALALIGRRYRARPGCPTWPAVCGRSYEPRQPCSSGIHRTRCWG